MSILKNVLVVLRGSLVAQAISFAALPMLARFFAPEDFGRFQIFQSVLGFLLLSASLRYELAILSAEDDAYAFSLARLCFFINGVLAALTLILCALFHYLIPEVVLKLGRALWLLPCALLAGGAFQTLTYLLLRSHAFHESSAARGIQALANSGTALGLGYAHVAGVGLMLADLAGRTLAVVYAFRKMCRKDERYKLWHNRRYRLLDLFRKYKEYPQVSLPGSLLDGIGSTLTPILMFGVFGAAISGQYALVERSIAMPIAVIAQAVSQVYMASFSTALRTCAPNSAELFKKVVFTHFKIAIIPAIFLFLFGRWAFELVFGAQWGMAGRFAEITAPLMLVSFMAIPVNMTLLLLNRQRLNFIWYVGRTALLLAMWVVISALDMAPVVAVGAHVAINVAAYLVLLFMIYKSVTNGFSRMKAAST